MTVEFKDRSDVDLIQFAGGDENVVHSARVSLGAGHDEKLSRSTVRGLINHMMKNRHGSVFEHNLFTFRVHTPIFVAREFMRHRMFSYNEESGRYKTMDPVFYVPPLSRKLRQEGKASEYKLIAGSDNNNNDWLNVQSEIKDSAVDSWVHYANMLEAGIAREVARMVLPVNIFTTFYATANARSLMNFLSLRIDDEANAVPTHPMAEIQEVAWWMEDFFGQKMPETLSAFYENGRVAP